jgi:ubiquinone/menaquinone biosynthesis C-methylase UbiE/uncharacterized membrane protein YphA (DoxX/SURF4 family)
VAGRNTPVNQCSKPTGWLGQFTLWRMNPSHSKLTDWGLNHISIENQYTILDVGCGGGRTVRKLAAIATQGKVYGVDYSDESVAATKRTNARSMDLGRVDIRHGSVSQLPFPDGMFDLITAVETHFWWPNLPGDMREVFRVLKPGGALIFIAEIYKGANTIAAKFAEKYASRTGMTLLSVEEHRELCTNAGYSDVQVIEERADNLVYVPKWMPLGGEFWIILTGICFVLAGLAILSGIQDVLAARLLALMFLAFNAFALPPFIVANPKDHAAWGGNAFNLAVVCATWIFADSIATRQQPIQNQQSAKPSLA